MKELSAFHPPVAGLAGEGAVGTHRGVLLLSTPGSAVGAEGSSGMMHSWQFLPLPLLSLFVLCLCKCLNSLKPAQVNSAGEAENTNPLSKPLLVASSPVPHSLFHLPLAELYEPPEAGTDSPRHGSYFYQFGGNIMGIVP